MGFGAMFLGVMFLYDFQLGLRHPGAETAYAMLDIFPDAVGWLLLFFGLRSLSKHGKGFEFLRNLSVLFLVLSLFTLAKDTFLYPSFYHENVQTLPGEAVDFCVHLLELAFLARLFSGTSKLCRKKGDDKLASSHATVPRIAAAEGFLFVVARIMRLFPLPDGMMLFANVVSILDFLFHVLLVWYGAIAMFRALHRISAD